MDKKGFEISLVELLKLVLAFMIIVGVFIPLGLGIYNFFVQKPNEQTLDNLAIFATEANSLEKGKSITIPLSIEDKFAIVSFNKNDSKQPKLCKSQTCLCLYSRDKDNVDLTKAPLACELMRTVKLVQSPQKILDGSKSVISISIENQEGKTIFNTPKTI